MAAAEQQLFLLDRRSSSLDPLSDLTDGTEVPFAPLPGKLQLRLEGAIPGSDDYVRPAPAPALPAG